MLEEDKHILAPGFLFKHIRKPFDVEAELASDESQPADILQQLAPMSPEIRIVPPRNLAWRETVSRVCLEVMAIDADNEGLDQSCLAPQGADLEFLQS